MSRMSFSDLVRGTGVNYAEEYRSLLTLLTGKAYEIFPDSEFRGGLLDDCEIRSFCDVCDQNFEMLPVQLRGTCRTIGNFNCYYNFFPQNITNPTLDDLLLFAEYALTFSIEIQKIIKARSLYVEKLINQHILQHLFILKDKLQHDIVFDSVFVRLVPTDMVAVEIASQMPKDVSIKTLMYRHRSMIGNIREKKYVLKLLGDQLEPQRDSIDNRDLESAIFSILNNMNIRHNNVCKGDKNYRPFVGGLSAQKLEAWYDRLYRMMLAAFAGLDTKNDLEVYKDSKDVIGSNVHDK